MQNIFVIFVLQSDTSASFGTHGPLGRYAKSFAIFLHRDQQYEQQRFELQESAAG